MKKIKRTKEMPKWGTHILMNNGKTVYVVSVLKDGIIKPVGSSWTNCKYYKPIKIKPYCTDWTKSLRKITDKPTRKQLKARIKDLEEKEKKVKEFLGKYSMNDLIKAITKNTCLHEKSKLISSMKNSNESEVHNMYSCKHCDEAIHEVIE
jgi:hypothetical protein